MDSISSETSDGISGFDWDKIRGMSADVANAAICDDQGALRKARSEILSAIKQFIVKYGEKPSLLATKADYVEDLNDRIPLLEKAYEISCDTCDVRNKTYISQSLAELYIDDMKDMQKGAFWVKNLAESLASYSEPYEAEEYIRLSSALKSEGDGA